MRLPVAIVATGILLSGCASATTGSAPSSSSAPSSASDDAAAPVRAADAAPLPVLTIPSSKPTVTAARTAVKPNPHKVVYLTFDDGPGPIYTKQVLALLEQYHAHATFFVIGRQTTHSKKILRAEYAAGNGIGNHTWDHQSLAHMSWAKFKKEVLRTQTSVKAAIGHAPLCLRPPGGAMDKHTKARAKKLGLKIKLWTIDTDDWKRPGAKAIAHRAGKAHNGSIVLMHDGGGNRSQTVKALRTILQKLSAKGYTFQAMCR